jgi:hypothetical protein
MLRTKKAVAESLFLDLVLPVQQQGAEALSQLIECLLDLCKALALTTSHCFHP